MPVGLAITLVGAVLVWSGVTGRHPLDLIRAGGGADATTGPSPRAFGMVQGGGR